MILEPISAETSLSGPQTDGYTHQYNQYTHQSAGCGVVDCMSKPGKLSMSGILDVRSRFLFLP